MDEDSGNKTSTTTSTPPTPLSEKNDNTPEAGQPDDNTPETRQPDDNRPAKDADNGNQEGEEGEEEDEFPLCVVFGWDIWQDETAFQQILLQIEEAGHLQGFCNFLLIQNYDCSKVAQCAAGPFFGRLRLRFLHGVKVAFTSLYNIVQPRL